MTSLTNLGDDIEVGDEGALQHDGDVGGVEELDGVGAVLASVTSTLDRKVNSEALHGTYEHSQRPCSLMPRPSLLPLVHRLGTCLKADCNGRSNECL